MSAVFDAILDDLHELAEFHGPIYTADIDAVIEKIEDRIAKHKAAPVEQSSPEEWLAAHPEAVEHSHAEGIFCDDCPDALRRNIKRVLVQHQWTNDYYDRNCTCGWSMPFTETHQHAAHLADVLSATLTDLGWQRTASLLASGALVPAEAAEKDEWAAPCPTPGCEGDRRYAAPGRRHREGCHYPLLVPDSEPTVEAVSERALIEAPLGTVVIGKDAAVFQKVGGSVPAAPWRAIGATAPYDAEEVLEYAGPSARVIAPTTPEGGTDV